MPQHSSRPPCYRLDAVPIGPFENEPFDLMRMLLACPDTDGRAGDEARTRSEAWLTGALGAARVVLGVYDEVVVRLLAEEGWTTVQVVAGWLARANGTMLSESEHR